jgi:hypothetical protein
MRIAKGRLVALNERLLEPPDRQLAGVKVTHPDKSGISAADPKRTPTSRVYGRPGLAVGGTVVTALCGVQSFCLGTPS